MERVVVGRGSSHKVRHEVAEVGCTLQWEFFTTDYDIAFELSVIVKTKSAGKAVATSLVPCIHFGGSDTLRIFFE